MLEKIRSKYILELIIKNHLDKKIYLQLVKYNKNLQEKLKIKLKDYKYCSEKVIIDLYPKNELIKDQQYNFININDNERRYFHIFFDENKKEENRCYITGNDKINKIRVIIESKIKSFSGLFIYCNCLEKINFIRCNNNIENLYNTFCSCESLIDLNVSKLKTDKVKNMRGMFQGCSSLKELNLSNFNTKNVLTMYEMFSGCSSLEKLIINNFDTSKVTNMNYMFYKCINLKSLDITNFNTENVVKMIYMFYHCDSLINLDITNFNLVNVEKMYCMFSGCKNILKDLVRKQNSGLKQEAFLKCFDEI